MSKASVPKNILGTVGKRLPPRRVPNDQLRKREYLTKKEIDQLIAAARKTVGMVTEMRCLLK